MMGRGEFVLEMCTKRHRLFRVNMSLVTILISFVGHHHVVFFKKMIGLLMGYLKEDRVCKKSVLLWSDYLLIVSYRQKSVIARGDCKCKL